MRDDVAKAITIVEEVRDFPYKHVEADHFVPNMDHVLAVLRGIDPEPVQQLHGATAQHSRPAGEESPWHAEPPDAHLVWLDDVAKWDGTDLDGLGYLHWYDVHGDRAAIPVTRGTSTKLDAIGHVWHIEDVGDGMLQVSPSVHFIGFWHSPNPVLFRSVEALPVPPG